MNAQATPKERPSELTLAREDLSTAVDRLIQKSRIKITREDKTTEWQTQPSLWDLLKDAAGWKGASAGGGAFGSRPVISAGAIDIIVDITTAVAETADELNITKWTTRTVNECTCQPYRACTGTRTIRDKHNTTGELRAIAANLTETDMIRWWTESINKWIANIRAALRLTPELPRNLRNTKCPACGAQHVTIDGGAGEKVRNSALTVVWTCPPGDDHKADADWTVRAIECQECGQAWFRGTDLEQLVNQIVENNRTRETMTDIA